MELLTIEFFTSLLSIIVIDLVLAGDNALLIGLAARKLPANQQKKVIFFGALGAVLIRSFATLVVVWILNVPGLLFLGGIVLIIISYNLLIEKKEDHGAVKAENDLWSAVRTIIIADAAMGLDNVIAVAGAAHGNLLLVILGLLISIPVVVWGSTLILKLIERFPIVITVGAGILAWTAGKMIIHEPIVQHLFNNHHLLKWTTIVLIIAGVLTAGTLKNAHQEKRAVEG